MSQDSQNTEVFRLHVTLKRIEGDAPGFVASREFPVATLTGETIRHQMSMLGQQLAFIVEKTEG